MESTEPESTQPVNRAGVNRAGVKGAGVKGAGVNRAGVNGAGVNGAGADGGLPCWGGCCMVDQGGDVLNKANIRGLWSVNNINCLPSNMKGK